MDKYVYGMYGSEDQLDNNDRLYNKFLDIFVLNPRTHIRHGKARYTDYEIHVKTNHPEFAIKDSRVRRRYSEFAWLKARLGMNDVMMTTAPSLPGKKVVGRFKDPFLMERQMGLQIFMNKVVEVNPFLSDPALHLFLQTDLSITQMESYLKHGVLLSNIRDRVIAEQKLREQKEKTADAYNESHCKELMCTITRSYSLDTILSIRKEETLEDKTGGRGWSNYIGDGVSHNEVLSDKDMTDFPGFNSTNMFYMQRKATARVLPGGQLQLADEPTDIREPLRGVKPSRRPSSWHGNPFDLVDFLLDSYDIISPYAASNVDSMSVSEDSTVNDSENTLYNDDSSTDYDDDDIEIDIASCLEEYTIISPLPQTEIEGHKSEQYNHRKLQNRQTDHRGNSSRVAKKPSITSTTETSYASLDTDGFRHSDSE